MRARDTLGEDVIEQMQREAELGAVAPKIPRQRRVPPALFISDDEIAEDCEQTGGGADCERQQDGRR